MAKSILGLDPKKFKVVKSDDKSTTLQHKDGHSLTIAHNVLSKTMQEQLKALSNVAKNAQTESQKQENEDSNQYGKVIHKYAQGGPAPADPEKAKAISDYEQGQKETPSNRAPAVRPTEQSAYGDESWPSPSQTSVGQALQNKAEGGNIRKMYAHGAAPVTQEASAEDINAGLKDLPKEAPEVQSAPEAQPTPVTGSMPFSSTPIASGDPEKPIIGPVVQDIGKALMEPAGTPDSTIRPADIAATKADAQVDNLENQKQNAEQVSEAAHEQAANQSQSDPLAHSENLIQEGLNQKISGEHALATAQGAQGEETAKSLANAIAVKQDAEDKYTNQFKDLNQERLNHIDDVQKGYINPELYWTGTKDPITGQVTGGHSKILSAIGMIIAGFNPAGFQGNTAVDMLKYQMNNNIEAQKQNLGAKQNLLTANLHQFGNLRDATDMTRVMMNDVVQNEIAKAAAKAATPIAAAQAEKNIGQLKIDSASLLQQTALRRAMAGLAGSGPQSEATYNHMLGYMRMVNPEYAKEMQSRIVPGVGISQNQAVPSEVRDKMGAKQELNVLANDLLQYSQTHTNINPASAEYKVGAAKAWNLKQKYREATLGGILRQGEVPLLDKILDANPANVFKSLNSIPQLKEMINLNNVSNQTLMKTWGVTPWAKQEQPAQQQGHIVLKNGIQYRKVPGGYVPIK